ncbi:G3BP-like protein isoform X1 [Canna indica]|uniref:G3BP-like protein isoform X1 n=1 Tax=Canna indica TaxID=4628 RepID=A0AAQ3QCQ9_9LILI|nr:G3BP-like protein isoform X1 [Canna indica]
MASEQPAAAGSPPPAQVVGNAFVHQYYHVLHHSPQLVFRFYHEISKLGRPDRQGDMTSVTGMEAINEKILSVDYSEFRAVIKTVDAQESIDGGVVVLVTGYLTGKDDVERNFIQSFFLATQDKGYYVRNDIFRYVGDDDDDQRLCDTVTSANSEPFAPEQEADPLNVDQLENEVLEEEELNEEVYDTSEDEDAPTFDKKTPEAEVSSEVPKSFQALVLDPSSSAVLDEAPKKSYASIVKVMKENPAAPQVPLPPPSKPSVANIEQQSSPTPPPAPATESSVDSNAVDSNSTQELEVDSYSIYIKNLPLNATPAQLEGEFKKFGPIKPGGIQVRSHKQQGFCFGFVEFEDATAVQSAIEASPVMIGGRQAFVEEKRPSSSRVGSRGRFLPIRGGGYRNDGVRGRSNYGGGRIFGRGDHNYSRSDFGHRGGGRGGPSNSGGGDFGYQRAYHGSSGGRGNRGGSNVSNWSSRNNAAQVPAAS